MAPAVVDFTQPIPPRGAGKTAYMCVESLMWLFSTITLAMSLTDMHRACSAKYCAGVDYLPTNAEKFPCQWLPQANLSDHVVAEDGFRSMGVGDLECGLPRSTNATCVLSPDPRDIKNNDSVWDATAEVYSWADSFSASHFCALGLRSTRGKPQLNSSGLPVTPFSTCEVELVESDIGYNKPESERHTTAIGLGTPGEVTPSCRLFCEQTQCSYLGLTARMIGSVVLQALTFPFSQDLSSQGVLLAISQAAKASNKPPAKVQSMVKTATNLNFVMRFIAVPCAWLLRASMRYNVGVSGMESTSTISMVLLIMAAPMFLTVSPVVFMGLDQLVDCRRTDRELKMASVQRYSYDALERKLQANKGKKNRFAGFSTDERDAYGVFTRAKWRFVATGGLNAAATVVSILLALVGFLSTDAVKQPFGVFIAEFALPGWTGIRGVVFDHQVLVAISSLGSFGQLVLSTLRNIDAFISARASI